MQAVRVGICGLGTVGGGTLNVLARNAREISRRAGRDIVVSHVGMRSPKPHLDLTGIRVSDDVFAVVNDPEVDVVVELIGGCDVAFKLVMMAIEQGKQVVTANKALIAEHGNEIFAAAHERGVMVAFEAAVAGGIPIIKALREGFSSNKINWLAGIINGTGNFILTEMCDHGRDFDDVLGQAQELGYAEADPTFDVEGIDAAHKLTILAAIAFGIPLQFDKVYTEGISTISVMDIEYAQELGYNIKHLGIAKQLDDGVELRVHPTLIPKQNLLANVHGVMNAVMVYGDAVGPSLLCGAGAGAEPTASAVVADVIDVVRTLTTDAANCVPHLAFQPDQLSDAPVKPIGEVVSGYYLRLKVLDQPGVMADISRILSEQGISMEAILQKDPSLNKEPGLDSDAVAVIILVREIVERKVDAAISAIEQLATSCGEVVKIRVAHLD